ncbi:hypothetical protein PRZ48_000139 [Zasmidium cellare]|uniref:ASST-domain-containing protein n=1 Tax=Zasmidium cellare TaxID=395010 RepID=A0ABR0EXN3_ZASCE|nr:hypothetical protein PRZ48_000139 [Zasmidium cellare]
MIWTRYAPALLLPAGIQALPTSNTTRHDYDYGHGYEHLPELPSTNSYHTVPDNGTVLNITKTSPNLSPGLIFLTLNSIEPTAEHQQGPYILTSAGDLVWSGGDFQASNLRVQELNGESVLTYWKSTSSDGGGYGEVVVLNSALEEVASVCPDIDVVTKQGSNTTCVADVHESYITERGTMLLTIYNITTTNLTSVGGPASGWVYDCLAAEVSLSTNEILWSWSALEHVPLTASKLSLGTHGQNSSDPWSWFHMNSLQPFRGDVFVNSRETWGSYYVSRQNGSILWSIDGASSGANFSWQHHARLHSTPNPNHLVLTYFADNNDLPTTSTPSVALTLLLTPSSPPTLLSSLHDPVDPIASFAEGSHQPLDGSGAFVGYGTALVIKEFNTQGEVLYSADFGYRDLRRLAESYRAFKNEWHAVPSTRIALVVSGEKAFVSWDGATDVDSFLVFAGNGTRAVGRVLRRGFETGFEIPGGCGDLLVRGVVGGRVVGMSGVVKVG